MKKKGVTLVELIAVIAIMSIVYGIIYTIFSSGNRIYKTGNSELQFQDTARNTLMRVSNSIKEAETITPGTDEFSFRLYKDNIERRYVVRNNELFEEYGSNSILVSSNISALNVFLVNGTNTYSVKATVVYDGKTKEYSTTISMRNRGW